MDKPTIHNSFNEQTETPKKEFPELSPSESAEKGIITPETTVDQIRENLQNI